MFHHGARPQRRLRHPTDYAGSPSLWRKRCAIHCGPLPLSPEEWHIPFTYSGQKNGERENSWSVAPIPCPRSRRISILIAQLFCAVLDEWVGVDRCSALAEPGAGGGVQKSMVLQAVAGPLARADNFKCLRSARWIAATTEVVAFCGSFLFRFRQCLVFFVASDLLA